MDSRGPPYKKLVARPGQAVAEGQCCFPRGLFFGGSGLGTESRLVLGWIGRISVQRRVVDIHSGLGCYGMDSLLIHYSSASDRGRLLRRIFGDKVRLTGMGVAYRVKGGHLEELDAGSPRSGGSRSRKNFGTYGGLKILKTLRDENPYHHRGPHIDAEHPTKIALRPHVLSGGSEMAANGPAAKPGIPFRRGEAGVRAVRAAGRLMNARFTGR